MTDLDLPSWIQALSALAVVVFTYQLVRVSKAQAKTTAIAAKAAEDSARAAQASAAAAELALHVDRPYLVVERVDARHSAAAVDPQLGDPFASRDHYLNADVRIRNVGARPAIWTGVVCDIAVIPMDKDRPPDTDYASSHVIEVNDAVIVPGHELSTLDDERIPFAATFTPAEWEALCDFSAGRALIRGRILYRGARDRLTYTTDFCWWYEPGKDRCRRAHGGNVVR